MRALRPRLFFHSACPLSRAHDSILNRPKYSRDNPGKGWPAYSFEYSLSQSRTLVYSRHRQFDFARVYAILSSANAGQLGIAAAARSPKRDWKGPMLLKFIPRITLAVSLLTGAL